MCREAQLGSCLRDQNFKDSYIRVRIIWHLDLAENSEISFLIFMTDVKYFKMLLFISGRCSTKPLQQHEDVCRNLKHINPRKYPWG